jgi:hypothetical protein
MIYCPICYQENDSNTGPNFPCGSHIIALNIVRSDICKNNVVTSIFKHVRYSPKYFINTTKLKKGKRANPDNEICPYCKNKDWQGSKIIELDLLEPHKEYYNGSKYFAFSCFACGAKWHRTVY